MTLEETIAQLEGTWRLANALDSGESVLPPSTIRLGVENVATGFGRIESHGAAPEIVLLVAQSFTAVGKYEESAQVLRDYLKNHPKDPGAATAHRWLDRLAADGKIHRN